MKYHLTTLHVNDMEKSLEFYIDIGGLEVQKRFKAGPMELVFIGFKGEPNIELIYDPEKTGNNYEGFTLGFEVESLENATTVMKEAGYKFLNGPISPNPTTTFSFFEGPNGETVQFIEYKEE